MTGRMKASDVLDAIRRDYGQAAVVPELVLDDPNWLDDWEPKTTGAVYGTCRRIDALMVFKKQRTAIEIKVSRSDYLREDDRKRRPWRAICHRFVYAVPEGLITPDEVPDGIGLWEVCERLDCGVPKLHVQVAKRAKINRNPDPVPDQLFVAMCYRASSLRSELERRAA